MCYHVSNHRPLKEIAEKFKREVKNPEKFKPGYHLNGFDKPYLPVISNADPKVIDLYRWKLVPTWVKDEATYKANTLNARDFELFEKSSYSQFVQNRCLVICTGFFEPHNPDYDDKPLFSTPIRSTKQQYTESWYIKPAQNDFFMLGGIWSPWNGINTLTIVTTTASQKLAKIHNDGERAPLILEGEAAKTWLKPFLSIEEMKSVMHAYPHDDQLIGYQTIEGVMNTRIDTNKPEAILPLHKSE